MEEVEKLEAQEVVDNDINNTGPQEPVEVPAKNDPQTSFQQLREHRKRLEAENLELQRQLETYKSQTQTAAQKRQLSDDDVAMGADLKDLREEITSLRKEHKKLTADQMLRMQYPDIEQVVSAKNIEMLRDQYPAIAQSLGSNNDYYSQAAAAYDIIKKLGISQDAYSKEKETVQRNTAKPRPVTSLNSQEGANPLDRANAFANGMTPELKEQLLKEMNDAIRRGY